MPAGTALACCGTHWTTSNKLLLNIHVFLSWHLGIVAVTRWAISLAMQFNIVNEAYSQIVRHHWNDSTIERAYLFLLASRGNHRRNCDVCISFRINFLYLCLFRRTGFVSLRTSPPSPSKKRRHRRLIRRWSIDFNPAIPIKENSLKCKRDPWCLILGTVIVVHFVSFEYAPCILQLNGKETLLYPKINFPKRSRPSMKPHKNVKSLQRKKRNN